MPLLFSDDLCSAFTAAVIRSFQEQEPSGYLGRTALQKLTYFSKAIGVPIPCSFEIYNYGPYSDDITKSVNRLMADEAIEDVAPSWARYSSYRLGLSANDFSPSIMEVVESFKPLIDSIVKVLGDLGPATLELVATLHFVSSRLRGYKGSRPNEKEVVKEFKSIKGNKFGDDEIHHWYGWLDEIGLIEA